MSELPHEVEVCIEVPRGGRIKRRSDGRLAYVSPFSSPFNYGCVPGTLAPDGEPIDALVLGPVLPRGTLGRWAVFGVVRFVDAGVPDDKLVCGEHAPTPSEIRTIERFFVRYARIKRLFRGWTAPGPTRFLGWERH